MKKHTLNKKFIIRVPSSIVTLYCPEKCLLTFIGPFKTESLKLKVRLIIKENTISITTESFFGISNKLKKNIKATQGTTVAEIKQNLVKVSAITHKKMKLVGVGYKVFSTPDTSKKNELFTFKLGYSHLLYFRIPKGLNIFCVKFTTLFVYGDSYKNLTEMVSRIKDCKRVEPYKGKGFLYYDEKIILKEGKRV